MVLEFAKAVDFAVIFVHEPRPGVANARNTAVKAANGDFIAFLDDDEEAPKEWLSGLLEVQSHLMADVVFGPVKARLAQKTPRFSDYFTDFFSRYGPPQDQILKTYYGCGNSLVRRAALPTKTDPFSIGRNNMGGEDDELFQTLLDENKTIAWAHRAFVYEDVPEARARLRYTLRRAFAFGQGPAFTAWQTRRFAHIIYWMAQGLVQGGIFSVLGLFALFFRHPKSADLLDKAARGVGKFLWFEPFKFHFYGTALLRPVRSL
jgi:glycosyltransferase involved in cell wall biosynthesis